MNPAHSHSLVIGAGVSGLLLSLELVRTGQKVTLIDRDSADRIGGLARWAFGGMALCQTDEQQKSGIPDSPELLLKDWLGVGKLKSTDIWPNKWAEVYARENKTQVYDWLKAEGFRFLPAVSWPERGDYQPGNSVPRYHILWGTGRELVEKLVEKLQPFMTKGLLEIHHEHRVDHLLESNGIVCGVSGVNESNQQTFNMTADRVVVATGGINGSIEQLIKHWPHQGRTTQQDVLNGAHPNSDGAMHYEAKRLGANLTHLNSMWNYAAGISHPQAHFPGHGLSLVPCKSALWMNHRGERIGPDPMVTGFDTSQLCERLSHLERPWTWHILNWKIACKELAISGSEHNPAIADHNLPRLIMELLLGNKALVKRMLAESEDFLVADNVSGLVKKMNELTGTQDVEEQTLQSEIDQYDAQYLRPEKFWNDDQIRRIQNIRQWKSDKLRTLYPQAITKKENGPLMAIRLRYINRKSLGGIQTDLSCQVLNGDNQPITGLYAIGEAAGFGGGGVCGKSTLEGTFLSCCILTARKCAEAITETSTETMVEAS